jgi:hypothetical protein
VCTLARLQQNQDDIGTAIVPYFGQAAGDQLAALLHEHISGAVTLVLAAKAGDTAGVAAAKTAWYANGQQTANPRFWSQDTMRDAMQTHLDQTLQEAVDRLQGNHAAEIQDYEHASSGTSSTNSDRNRRQHRRARSSSSSFWESSGTPGAASWSTSATSATKTPPTVLTLSRAAALLHCRRGAAGISPRSYMETVGDGNYDAAQGDPLRHGGGRSGGITSGVDGGHAADGLAQCRMLRDQPDRPGPGRQRVDAPDRCRADHGADRVAGPPGRAGRVKVNDQPFDLRLSSSAET